MGDIKKNQWEEMSQIGCNANGDLNVSKFSQPIPWVGIYIAAASLVCLIGMAIDAIISISHRKFWFPTKYFSLNATSLTLIAVAVKLSVDLNTSMPRHHEQLAKLTSSAFICTIIGNFMPSLGAMDKNEMFMNLIALGILVITVIVNICIQLGTGVIFVFWKEHILFIILMLVLLLLTVSSALTVPTTKHHLEYKYCKKYEMAIKECSAAQSKGTITERFRAKLMKYWMMAHTSSPQFVLGRSPTCTASGFFCLVSVIILAEAMLRSYLSPSSFRFCNGESDYKWSTIVILVTQGAAVLVGTIAPALRWFVAIKYRCPKLRKKGCEKKKRFRVENYWIENLLEVKECPLNIRIRHRRCRKLVHDAKVLFLNLCIRLQMGIVLISKLTGVISISIITSIVTCCNHCKKLKLRTFSSRSVSTSSTNSDSSKQDLSRFVLHLEGEEELVEVMMRDNRDATNHWIQVGESREPKLLIQLLEKSSVLEGFKRVGEFDCDQIASLHPEEPPNCWSLPLVTLITIAVALPSINKASLKSLMDAVKEGLHYVNAVENILDKEGRLIRLRHTADIVWHGVDLYHRWFNLDLTKLSLQAESSKEILQKLADAAKTRYEKHKIKNINVCLRASPSGWPVKVLAANSMYRVSKSVLLKYESKDEIPSDEALFEELRLVIADMLGSCLTNLPHVISAKCVESAIEEREDSVRHAGYIFGKTKRIMEMLDKTAFPNGDGFCTTKIDDWRLMHIKNTVSPFSPSSPESTNSDKDSSKPSDLYLTVE